MDSARKLEGKICFITGASRGIGNKIAETFAKNGAVVYVNARNAGCLDEWSKKISACYNTDILPVYFDITETEALKACFQRIRKERHRLDVLVNNAGITSNELIGMIQEETVYKLFNTNVFATIQSLQFAARIMMRQKKGVIINISSIIGVCGAPEELVYSGTKGAIISITKSASKELASYGIRVNSVAPGYVDTDMFHNAAKTQENEEKHIRNIGLGRLADPEDIAEACVFLAGDSASYITGEILGVNGGAIL